MCAGCYRRIITDHNIEFTDREKNVVRVLSQHLDTSIRHPRPRQVTIPFAAFEGYSTPEELEPYLNDVLYTTLGVLRPSDYPSEDPTLLNLWVLPLHVKLVMQALDMPLQEG